MSRRNKKTRREQRAAEDTAAVAAQQAEYDRLFGSRPTGSGELTKQLNQQTAANDPAQCPQEAQQENTSIETPHRVRTRMPVHRQMEGRMMRKMNAKRVACLEAEAAKQDTETNILALLEPDAFEPE